MRDVVVLTDWLDSQGAEDSTAGGGTTTRGHGRDFLAEVVEE